MRERQGSGGMRNEAECDIWNCPMDKIRREIESKGIRSRYHVMFSLFFFSEPFNFFHRLSFLFTFFSVKDGMDSFLRISLTKP